MAPTHSSRYLCGSCEIGQMGPSFTPAGEAIYRCFYCGHAAMQAFVEADNIPLPPSYGSRVLALWRVSGCDLATAAAAVADAHRQEVA